MTITIIATSDDDINSTDTEPSTIAVPTPPHTDMTTIQSLYRSNLNRALHLGAVELTENLLHPIILLLLKKKSTNPTIFNDIGLLAPSLMFRMLTYIPLSNLLPMAKEAYAQPSIKASIYLTGVIYAAMMASVYPSLYQWYDSTRLDDFNQQQHHAMQRLNTAQRLDIVSQLMKIIFITNDQQRPLLMLTMLAGMVQISYIATHADPGLEDHVTGVQLSSVTRLVLLGSGTLLLLRRINAPFAQYCITIRTLGSSTWQLVRRSTPIIMQNLIAFNVVSTVAGKLHDYHLIGLNHVLVSLADLPKSFIHGMTIACQSQIANTYLSEPTHAKGIGQHVIARTLALSSLLPVLYAAVTYYNDKDHMKFFIWMGFINILSTLESVGQELIKGIDFNLIPNAVNSLVSLLVPYALLTLDDRSNLQEFSISTVLQMAVTLRVCVILGTWMLRMRHLTLNQHEVINSDQAYVKQIDHNSMPEPHPDIENPPVISESVSRLSYLRNTGYRLTNNLYRVFYWRTPRLAQPPSIAKVELQPSSLTIN